MNDKAGPELTLCATARLAQTLRGASPDGAKAWRTPPALTLGQWLAALAEAAMLTEGLALPQALDPFAESLLWEKAVASSLSDAAPLFDIHGMAASAAEAQALCRIWKLRPAAAALSDEARQFLGWQAEFERRCTAAGWSDAAGLQRRIIELIGAGRFALPAAVAFVGFDRPTPLERDLAAALAGRGVDARFVGPSAAPGQIDVLPCADGDAECRAAVAWAADWLAGAPAARLGIVAPDLAAVRDRLAFMLDDALHPWAIRPQAAEMPRCFNFSLGQALAEVPLARIALACLALAGARGKVEQARLSALLLAGHWSADQSEADGRAWLDAAMRNDLPYFTSLSALLRLGGRLAETAGPACPRSRQALADFAARAAEAPRKARPSQWAAIFRQCLAALGWPGERPLSSHEFQAHRAFSEALDAFARLDGILGNSGFAEAAGRFARLCRQRLFQPETRGQPAIQILGVLESAGLDFDGLWVMGMTDEQWPPPPRPNPLLPADMLRAAGASHASAEVELDFARRVHERLCRSAPVVRFSHARVDGNRVLRPSPLLAGLAAAPILASTVSADRARDTAPTSISVPPFAYPAPEGDALEYLDDALAPPVAAGEKVPGGSWLLRAQAICPAWAFYQYRLGAEAMAVPVEGLDPAARGTLVHAALEAFWQAVRDSAALAAQTPEAREQAVGEAVAAALESFERERHVTLPGRFRQLEGERLRRLLGVWLALEADRPAPFTVLACEEMAEIEIEGVRVRMVVDRIDRLDDGRRVILDYKTGAAIDIRNWAEARITEPQLPIYAALVAEDDVRAVVFAKVLVDKPAFAGIADERDILPGVQGVGDEKQRIFDPARFADWPAVLAHWRDSLRAVAREVGAGRAGVAVADERALQYCEVLPLLRLPERRRLWLEGVARPQGGAKGAPAAP